MFMIPIVVARCTIIQRYMLIVLSCTITEYIKYMVMYDDYK